MNFIVFMTFLNDFFHHDLKSSIADPQDYINTNIGSGKERVRERERESGEAESKDEKRLEEQRREEERKEKKGR